MSAPQYRRRQQRVNQYRSRSALAVTEVSYGRKADVFLIAPCSAAETKVLGHFPGSRQGLSRNARARIELKTLFATVSTSARPAGYELIV
jgi:hypothetical protein